MEGKRTLRRLFLRNLLSFGGEGQALELEPLNVLIGPNGSGKSNLIEALDILRALPRDVMAPFRSGGGVDAFFWKGAKPDDCIEIEGLWEFEGHRLPLRHQLFLRREHRLLPDHVKLLRVAKETIDEGTKGKNNFKPHYFYQTLKLNGHKGPEYYDAKEGVKVGMASKGFDPFQSILFQRKDPERSPAISYLERILSKLFLFRSWAFGPDSPIRSPQTTDLPSDFLLENSKNLVLVLNHILNSNQKKQVFHYLKKLYDGILDFRSGVGGGFAEFSLEETPDFFIPSTRLSDGTLRFLSLLAILCHPQPPPLICIEEPELGLHPEILPIVGQLLIEASQRTQLIVTTHSEDLVSGVALYPEVVVICEKNENGTLLRRLEPKKMEKWLEEYSLGGLWRSGEIGGNRW